MQHHGAPTRLLDWSYSPFVSAFFAFQQLSKGCAVYEIDLVGLGAANASLAYNWKDNIFESAGNFIAPYLPVYQNERLILQQGLFLVPGNIYCDVEDIVESYSHHERFITKYVLDMSPTSIKDAIKKLKAMNIDDYRLFPGIDGLSRSMYLQLIESKPHF